MAKKLHNFRLSLEAEKKLLELCAWTGKDMTAIVESSIDLAHKIAIAQSSCKDAENNAIFTTKMKEVDET